MNFAEMKANTQTTKSRQNLYAWVWISELLGSTLGAFSATLGQSVENFEFILFNLGSGLNQNNGILSPWPCKCYHPWSISVQKSTSSIPETEMYKQYVQHLLQTLWIYVTDVYMRVKDVASTCNMRLVNIYYRHFRHMLRIFTCACKRRCEHM